VPSDLTDVQPLSPASSFTQGTFSSDKHEMLFQRFGINYNALPARYRKGSMVIRVENKVRSCLVCKVPFVRIWAWWLTLC
jgi:tRNA(His) 5'-end guanylyltransferase